MCSTWFGCDLAIQQYFGLLLDFKAAYFLLDAIGYLILAWLKLYLLATVMLYFTLVSIFSPAIYSSIHQLLLAILPSIVYAHEALDFISFFNYIRPTLFVAAALLFNLSVSADLETS